ncbi:MAG: hypothetical protein ABL995_11215 [Bryobacteraceae bacterium]
MKTTFAAMTVFGLSLAFLPQAKADGWNKRTVLTVHKAIQVPGAVLEPGKYVMSLHDIGARNIVQIMNEQENDVIATMLTIPHYRNRATDKTEFRFWEIAEGQPKPLRVWFYPGDVDGREFVYYKGFATRIAQASHSDVPALESDAKTEAALEKTRVEMVTEKGVEKAADLPLYAKSDLPKSELAMVDQSIQGRTENAPPATAPPAAPPHDQLPATASVLPLAGLASAAALCAGMGLRRIAGRM